MRLYYIGSHGIGTHKYTVELSIYYLRGCLDSVTFRFTLAHRLLAHNAVILLALLNEVFLLLVI